MIVAAHGLRKRFGALPVLEGISMRLEAGDRTALLGPSGCGKTTLLRILQGLEAYDEGSIEGGLPRAGYLPQGALLLPWKTVRGNVELPLQMAGLSAGERRRRSDPHFQRFGLAGFEEAYPYELSGGMRQRAGLLRAILTDSLVLVLDEPFGALDTRTRHQLQVWLVDLLDDLVGTLLFVTHDADEAIRLAARVVVLTDRPAQIAGEQTVLLDTAARRARWSPDVLAARDRLLRLVLMDERRPPEFTARPDETSS